MGRLSLYIFFSLLSWISLNVAHAGRWRNTKDSSGRFSIEIAGVKDGDSTSCMIPFSKAGNLIVVKGKADTTEGNFILDTGAPYLVLNITYFRDYPSTVIADADRTGLTGSNAGVVQTTVSEFIFGSMHYLRMHADLTNLGHIENTRGIKILGLLGMEMFRQCEMIIDYDKSVIYLHRIAKKEAAVYRHELLMDTATYSSFPIDIMDNRIIAGAELAGKKLKFVIDCAAESNVLDSRLPNTVFEQVVITRRVMLSGSGDKKVEALYGEVKKIKFGNRVVADLPVLITNLEKTCFSYMGCVDGILGFDFLSMHRVGFNFVNHKMYIWK
ncbi:MAG: aspartyl protease family protein [Flavisolibacter sp.]